MGQSFVILLLSPIQKKVSISEILHCLFLGVTYSKYQALCPSYTKKNQDVVILSFFHMLAAVFGLCNCFTKSLPNDLFLSHLNSPFIFSPKSSLNSIITTYRYFKDHENNMSNYQLTIQAVARYICNK